MRYHLDFESRATVDIKVVGGWAYAMHPDTEVLCLAVARHGQEPVLLTDFTKPPNIPDDVVFVAHNAHFEYAIYHAILVKRFGWPAFRDPKHWECTLSRAAVCGLPLSLEKCAAATGILQKKDLDGRAAMLKLCKPVGYDCLGDPIYRNDPALFKHLYRYCKQDVRTEMALDDWLPPLSPDERRVWELDLKMNARGVAVDVETARKAQELTVRLTAEMNARLTAMTAGGVSAFSRIAEMKRYLATHGIVAESLDKAAVNEILSRPDLPPVVREVLALRREAGKSSTAKFAAIVNTAGPDGRVRGVLQYHAAHTGRWGGRLIQPQNFPKGGDLEEQTQTIQAIQTGGDVSLDGLSRALRGMIWAAKGKKLVAADFNAIEARVVFWLAGDRSALDTYEAGGSPYLDMGAYLFKRPIDKKKDGREYAIAKATILGCFEAGTKVLTDRGWVSIVEVGRKDRLWDGVEWVAHEGVIYRGRKDTIRFAGIGVTPDHLFLTPDRGWVCASQVARASTAYRRLMTATVACGLRATSSAPGAGFSASGSGVVAAAKRWWTYTTCGKGLRLDATPAPRRLRSEFSKAGACTTPYSPTDDTVTGSSRASAPLSVAVTTRRTTTSTTTAEEVSGSTLLGGGTGQSFFDTSSRSGGGTTPLWRWIVSTLTGGIARAISGSPLARRIWETVAAWRNSNAAYWISSGKCDVYDVLNAGPRSRFTIWTDDGPQIVHNCGFGMGWVKFLATCQTQGIEGVTEAMAQSAVKAYREKYRAVVNLWYAAEKAAIAAVKGGPGTAHYLADGKIAYGMSSDKRFLVCRLPSGRLLRYYNPVVKTEKSKFSDEMRPVLYYSAAGLNGSLEEFNTYGGALVENFVQAVARDIMSNGMHKVEAAGYPLVLTVHDEIVAEKDGEPALGPFMQAMCDRPVWAASLPIAAEGWVGERYRK